MIVPDATPAVRVCGAVVKTSWLAAAGLTVSCCAAKARLAAAAVNRRRSRRRVSVLESDRAAASRYRQRRNRDEGALARARAQADSQRAGGGDRIAEGVFQSDVIVPEAAPRERLRRGGETKLGHGRQRMILTFAAAPVSMSSTAIHCWPGVLSILKLPTPLLRV